MRLLHTSDWHLGHTLKEVTREHEHQAFLTWLLETCARERPDVLLITGDVFDSATPPASAERMWFDFLAAARRQRPTMDVIAIAGNHDSPARLGAASAVLRELGVHVIGGLPRDARGAIDLDRVLIPVAGGRGLVAAVPFIRPIDYPVCPAGESPDPLGTIYGEVVAGARARKPADQALIVTGHLYVAGADVSFLSERRVSIGGQESVSARLFPEDIDYVALGHIHRAQRIGRDTMRYAGAPIALSLEEGHYKHQVVIVDFADGRVAQLRPLMIPRTIEILRIGPAPFMEVISEITALPARVEGERVDPTRPYLEVIVELARPEPRLRQVIETALDGKRPRLVRLGVEHTGDGAALADHGIGRRLAELDPREVFVRCWAKNHAEAPGEAVLVAFERLLAEVRGDAELLS
ncbi:MAG: exonuclease SbcCD subunit D C-terminal domain-containing protein [Deltaproteobacteria bacterium]|nr:exonuclease SbcCD subunit D C-terminal domain-containing protein [Deltaproteobacteria bacterium]